MTDVALSTLRWVYAQDGIDGVVAYVDMLIDADARDASERLAWDTLLPAVDQLVATADRYLATLAPKQRKDANHLAAAIAELRLPLRHAHQLNKDTERHPLG